MTKTIIIKDSVCLPFQKIHIKLVFQANYDLNAFSIDLRNAIWESGDIIKLQKNDKIKAELDKAMINEIYHILYVMGYYNRNKKEFWEQVN